MNIIRLVHAENGLPNPCDSSWFLTSLLRGCKRALGDKCTPKLPITIDLLWKLFQLLEFSDLRDITFWATCLVAFFSFLRKSNLLASAGQGQRGSPCYLRRGDVTFLREGALLRLKHTKTLQYNERELEIPLPHISGSPLCPSRALLLVYKGVSLPTVAPLFCYAGPHGPVTYTYQSFMWRLKLLLGQLGVDANRYAGHSFRRGGASFALACDLPPDLIQIQGDWRSNCYQKYLHPDLRTKFRVAKEMGTHATQSKYI